MKDRIENLFIDFFEENRKKLFWASVIVILSYVIAKIFNDAAGAKTLIGGLATWAMTQLRSTPTTNISTNTDTPETSVANNQKGMTKFIIVFMLLFSIGFSTTIIGCCATNKTATQQLMEQTDDIQMVALGTYADALTVYVEAQKTYLGYQSFLERTRPELNQKILEQFRLARQIRLTWKEAGIVGDTTEFRSLLRSALFMIAAEIDKKGGDS